MQGWAIVLGDAVFIPAGAPHQVCPNLWVGLRSSHSFLISEFVANLAVDIKVWVRPIALKLQLIFGIFIFFHVILNAHLPTPESAVRGRCGSRDRAPQRDLQALRRGLGNAAFCAVIFLFCNWQCEASPKVISGLCSWKCKAAPSSLRMEKPRNPLGGDHTNVAAPGSGEQGGPGRRSERQQLHFCPEAGVSFYREDGGWSEK